MKITFMVVGRTTTPYLRDAAADYLQRAARYMPVEFVVIPDIKASKKLHPPGKRMPRGWRFFHA